MPLASISRAWNTRAAEEHGGSCHTLVCAAQDMLVLYSRSGSGGAVTGRQQHVHQQHIVYPAPWTRVADNAHQRALTQQHIDASLLVPARLRHAIWCKDPGVGQALRRPLRSLLQVQNHCAPIVCLLRTFTPNSSLGYDSRLPVTYDRRCAVLQLLR